jgi:hypothetical protein
MYWLFLIGNWKMKKLFRPKCVFIKSLQEDFGVGGDDDAEPLVAVALVHRSGDWQPNVNALFEPRESRVPRHGPHLKQGCQMYMYFHTK